MIIHNINDLIKYGIHVHGGSSIPGIGTIKINRIPASYSIDRKKLISPTTTLTYFQEESKEFSILQYAEDCGIALDQVKLWSENMFRWLAEKEKSVLIPEVGSLSKSEAGIVFVSDNAINWNAYAVWPDIDIQPLSNPKRNYEFAVTQPKELTYAWKQNQNNSSTWLFPGIIVSLVLLFLGIKTCLPDSSKSVNIQQVQNIEVTETDSVASDTSAKEIQQAEIQQIDTSSSNIILDQIPDSNERKAVSEVSESKKSSKKIDCTYIVGAFLKKKNAEKLYNSLRKKGYEVIMLKHDSFTRVGMVIPCEKDLSVPEKIIRKFPDIWLLEE